MKWQKSIRTSRWKLDLARHAIIGDTLRRIPPAPHRPDPACWSADRVTLAWLGHSTVLINFFGITILTDPVLGSRIGPRAGPFVLGPKRLVRPALRAKDLPRVDLILLSHSHFDHMDLWTLKRLQKEAVVITAQHSSDLLRKLRFESTKELAWETRLQLFSDKSGGLKVEAFPTSHWGARFGRDRHRRWNGYILERRGCKMIFGGDTAMSHEFGRIRAKGPFDLAMMPIGSYDPWISAHCTPEQAIAMADAAGAHYIVPIHHRTFRLSNEPASEPIHRFTQALSHSEERIALRAVGETFVLPLEQIRTHLAV